MRGVEKVAWVLVRDCRLLVARNRDRELFYLPGGRREPDESHADTLVREAMEELRVRIDPSTMRLVAEVTAPRDGASDLVRMTCYTAEHMGDIVPANEIAEVGWFTVADYGRLTSAEQQVIDQLVVAGQMVG
jgi:8-oxo-dGTP pyrophosphatase MutT (NUDIX family)